MLSDWNRDSVLRDYRIAFRSQQVSLLARREVLTGKAKFGIFGDGKEVACLALARAFEPGDFRSGYYRDQTLMMAIDGLTPEQFFAQLYAHADPVAEPASAGRSMTAHFATPLLDAQGRFLNLLERRNSSAFSCDVMFVSRAWVLTLSTQTVTGIFSPSALVAT